MSEDSLLIIPLKSRQLARLQGKNVLDFLQGQVTCDIRKLSQNRHTPGAHCDPKGRMYYTFTAAQILTATQTLSDEEDCVALRLPEDILALAVDQLRKYAQFSKINVAHEQNIHVLALYAPQTQSIMNLMKTNVLPGEYTQVQLDSGPATLLRHDEKWFELWAEGNDIVNNLVNALPEANIGEENDWDSYQISQGLAEVHKVNSGELLPQEINLDKINGVVFDKGCYTGQEVIARLHYRGKLKKHTYRFLVHNDAQISINDPLYDDQNRVSGRVLRTSLSAEGNFNILALLRDELIDQALPFKRQDTALKVTYLPLPYAITN